MSQVHMHGKLAIYCTLVIQMQFPPTTHFIENVTILRANCSRLCNLTGHVSHLCVRPGFMLFMPGCMGTFPCGSFCLFFWWRRRRRRPSSSHHDDSRAARRAQWQVHDSSCAQLVCTGYSCIIRRMFMALWLQMITQNVAYNRVLKFSFNKHNYRCLTVAAWCFC